jgi:2-keto-4-pentenoate hydratase/2-oxohepta-3-ene-1,7-dioic acid hydratase in catechol pathway
MNSKHPTKIVCVGRNYVDHAKELGNDVPDRPILFLKPPSSLVGDGAVIRLPADSARVDHEAEIAVVIARKARHVAEAEALDVIAAYAPLNDVTARDLQKLDQQWTRAKGFDTFCPVGTPVPAADKDWRALEVVCRVNGTQRQRGRADQMVFGIPALIAYITRVMTLEPGDLIATGTPAGIGPLQPGDSVEIELMGLSTVRNTVAAENT